MPWKMKKITKDKKLNINKKTKIPLDFNDYIGIDHGFVIFKNIKHMYLLVNEDNEVIIKVPFHTTAEKIYDFVYNNQSYLKQHINVKQERMFKGKTGIINFFGKAISVIVVIEQRLINRLIFEKDKMIKFQTKKLDPEYNIKKFYEKMNKVLQEKIHDIISKKLNKEKEILKNITFKFRYMKTKWGVYNHLSQTITLNSKLIHKKPELIYYVLVHEMAHAYQQNHSKNFWSIVEKYIPNYKLLRKEINAFR